MDGADPPIPSHSSFNHPESPRGASPSISAPRASPLASLHSLSQEDDESKPLPPSPPPGDLSEATMSTRKRPRNSSSAARSSGGSTTTTTSSSSPSPSAMRRTTSLSDLAPPPDMASRAPTRPARGQAAAAPAGSVWGAEMRRHSASAECFTVPEAAFLKACGLCKRHLGPGRDTFIYMGEVAFCSQECRQQQMNLDELREKKCSTPAGGGSGGSSDQSGKSSTIAAA